MLPPRVPGDAQEVLPVLARHVRPEQLVRACEASPRDVDEPRFRDELTVSIAGLGHIRFEADRNVTLVGTP